MPITYDISKDRLYQKGIKQGVEENEYHLVKKALLNQKLTVEQIAEVIDVSLEFVLEVQIQLAKESLHFKNSLFYKRKPATNPPMK